MTKLIRAVAAVACASLLVVASSATAAETAPPVTITGKLACAMCILKQPGVKGCTNVVVVKEGGKEVFYALADNAATASLSMAACEKTLPVKVTGTVTEAAGKKTITATKVERTG
jgi:hypothetical protein